MMLSNALPIQFWFNGVETFNEKIEPGIEKKPYFHKVNYADEIRLQFLDTFIRNYKLKIFDSKTDELLQTVNFTREEIDGGYQKYELDFSFEDYTINNKKVWMNISYTEIQVTGEITGLLGVISGEIGFTEESFLIGVEITGLLGSVTSEIATLYELLLTVLFSSGAWLVDFDDSVGGTDTLNVPDTGSDSGLIVAMSTGTTMEAIVTRHDIDTFATVNWKLNGVIVHTELFTETDMSSLGYTYPVVTAGDVLEIEVIEPE